MNRNEYRRAFIMLRAAMPGYGGHVRLERRTLTGSMYFIITAPQGVSELSAALVGQRDGAGASWPWPGPSTPEASPADPWRPTPGWPSWPRAGPARWR